MLPSTYKKLQKEKLAKQKIQPHKRISNNFIENAIQNNTVGALKTLYYIATLIEDMEAFSPGVEKGMLKIEIDMKKMLEYTELTAPDIRRNIKSMQQTSITFINEDEKWEEGISLLPYYMILWGKNKIHIELYQKVANLIVEVSKNYTIIDTKALMNLRSKHTLRLLPLLVNISNQSIKGDRKNIDDTVDRNVRIEIPKRRKFDLDELNDFFGTKYKNLYEIDRRILAQAKEELDSNSKISFNYEIKFENLGKGRPKATSITIDVVEKKTVQRRLL